MINVNLCTLIFWVDDLCISHIDKSVIDKLIGDIKEPFGKVPGYPLTEHRGKVQKYLGIMIDYSTPKLSKIHHVRLHPTTLG